MNSAWNSEDYRKKNDKEGKIIVQHILNGRSIDAIETVQEKEVFIKALKSSGLSIRQISRLTGISVGIVRKF